MEAPKTIFRKYCRNNGMRYTPEREKIIDEIYSKDEHFDVDELFLRIRRRYPDAKLAKGSIYRTVPHLISAGLLREALNSKGRIWYEHTLGHQHHDHMRCVGCGRIFEFHDKKIDKARKDICKKFKFDMSEHVHVIEGYCSSCRAKQ